MWWIIGVIAILGLIKWASYRVTLEGRRQGAREYLAENSIADLEDEDQEVILDASQESIDRQLPIMSEEFIEIRETFIAIILICMDKLTELDERLQIGCYSAIIVKFFINDEASFSSAMNKIKPNLFSINEEEIIESANDIFSYGEKQYCYDFCEDICSYNNYIQSNDDVLDFIKKIVSSFGLAAEEQIERQKMFEAQKEIKFKTYKNSKYKLTLKIPQHWLVQEEVNDWLKQWSKEII